MADTYVTDLRHFLHVDGELADMPSQARQLASFLALIVDAITLEAPEDFDDTQLRCRVQGCKGTILARLDGASQEIHWHCFLCGHHGLIRNWQDTKWDRRRADEVG